MSIRDMKMLGIGETDDTGGTETTGTLMAKENAILEMLNKQSNKVKNNMVLKEMVKSIVLSEGQVSNLSFSFDKPVKFLGLYFDNASGFTAQNIPTYIINGENSTQITTVFVTQRSWYAVRWTGSTRSGYQMSDKIVNAAEIFPDIWLTQLDLHITGSSSGNTSAKVLYQEEG